ncbi:MAG: hypothetical protein WAM81_01690 [Acidimicrobiia bacterium]
MDRNSFPVDPAELESALAGELVRARHKLPGQLLLAGICELLIVACKAFSAPEVQDVAEAFDEAVQKKSSLLEIFEQHDDPERMVRFLKRLQTPAGMRFAEKLLGSATAHRLRRAAEKDLRIATPAIRKAMPRMMRVAYALDLCSAVPVSAPFQSETPALSALVGIAGWLDVFEDNDCSFTSGALGLPSPDSLRMAAVVRTLQTEVPRQALQRLEAVQSPLTRKLRGAYEALELSSDGISQAANSAVELVDRLFRNAFTNAQVLDWVSANATSFEHDELIRPSRDGTDLPTKRAEALCFISGGQNPGEAAPLHSAIADALVRARRTLEQVKHSDDETTPATSVQEALSLVEAAIVVAFSFTWLSIEQEKRDDLLQRLSAA